MMKVTKNIIWSLLFLFLLFGCTLKDQKAQYVPFQDNKTQKWGFIAEDGTIGMKAQFVYCPTAVVGDRFSVQDADGYWSLYSFTTKQIVSKRKFRSIGYFWGDVALAVEGDKMEILDKDANVLSTLSPSILRAHNFKEGEALVQFKNGSFGYVNTKGEATSFIFDYASDFSEGVAVVGNYDNNHNLQYQIINKSGKKLADLDVKGIQIMDNYRNGLLLFQDISNYQYGFFDKKGKRVEMTKKNMEYLAQLRKESSPYMNLKGKNFSVVVFDQFMSGKVMQNFTSQMPKDINPDSLSLSVLPELKQVMVDTAKLHITPMPTNLDKKARLEDALNTMALSLKQASIDQTDPAYRKVINNYVECVRVAYEEKNMPFLNQVFSEDALILVGRVVKSNGSSEGYLPQKQIAYNLKTKKEYLSKLSDVFKVTKSIQLKFSQVKITRHPTKEGFYGVTLKQGYRSDRYADEGYLFMLWDFRNPNQPKIHVRTWQPTMLNPKQPLPEQDIYKLSNFNLE